MPRACSALRRSCPQHPPGLPELYSAGLISAPFWDHSLGMLRWGVCLSEKGSSCEMMRKAAVKWKSMLIHQPRPGSFTETQCRHLDSLGWCSHSFSFLSQTYLDLLKSVTCEGLIPPPRGSMASPAAGVWHCSTLVTAVCFRLLYFTYVALGSEHSTASSSPVTLSHDYFIFGIKTINT